MKAVQILRFLKLLFWGAWLIRRIWDSGFEEMSGVRTAPADTCVFLEVKKTRKNIQTSSLTPQNGLTEVGRIDAFLALFPEELRLLGLSSPLPNGIEGWGLKGVKFPQVYQESLMKEINALAEGKAAVWAGVYWNPLGLLWRIQIKALLEACGKFHGSALKCFCPHWCAPGHLQGFFYSLFLQTEVFPRPGHCWVNRRI